MKYLILMLGLTLSMSAGATHFETGSHIPTDELKEELFKFYKDKLEGKQINSLVIEGHTDVRGGEQYNLDLSTRRADTALRELRKLGFRGENVVVKGLGESYPISRVHGENRRIVLRINGDDVTIIAECKQRIIIKERPMKKNSIKLLGGYGPTGLSTERRSNGRAVVTEDDGLILGVGYNRRLSERWSLEGNVLFNETYLIGAGYHF